MGTTRERSGRRRVTTVVAIAAIAVALLLFIPMPGFCDGNAPEWQPAPGGCTAVTPLWEFLVPWHWGAPDRCIGLCRDLAP